MSRQVEEAAGGAGEHCSHRPSQSREDTLVVSVVGNIGSGKSSLLDAIKEVSKGSIACVPEPISEWVSPVLSSGQSMLEAYYADKRRNAFAFQMFILLTRVRQIRRSIDVVEREWDGGPGAVVVVERGPWVDVPLIGQVVRDQGLTNDSEWLTLTEWSNESLSSLPALCGIVYLRTLPQQCVERIAARARDGENLIDADYVQQIHDSHEANLASTIANRCRAPCMPCLILDGQEKPSVNAWKVLQWIDQHRAKNSTV